MSEPTYDVLVIGEGIAGLATARAAAEAGLTVATLEANLFGGLVINVNELEPSPSAITSGAELASDYMQVNGDLGVASLPEEVVAIHPAGAEQEVETTGGRHRARHVVIASGAKLKSLGVPGEAEFEGRGVSKCADCDGPMFQNETVVVVGGGDSALQEALVLAHYCGAVRIVHHGAAFTARAELIERVQAEPKISTTWNATVGRIQGTNMVEGIELRHNDGHTEPFACAGVFAYIGLDPNSAFAPAAVDRDERGHLKTGGDGKTAVAGIWAVGAVRAGFGGQLTDAIADAQRAVAAIQQALA